MAQRRMFSMQIVDTDAFLEMPSTTQNLYFHLGMRADDDGFVDNAKKIMKIIGASDDDLKILFSKRFIIGFENGLIVIKHWKIHNYIAKDRYNETAYLDEKKKLFVKKNGSYTECIQECIQDDDTGKVRKGKARKVKDNKAEKIYITFPDFNNIKITQTEYDKLNQSYSKQQIDYMVKYLACYKVEKSYKTKSDYLTILRWVAEACQKKADFPKGDAEQKQFVTPVYIERERE